MRLRWCVLATALVLVVTACGGGSSGGGAAGGGLGGSTTTATAAARACARPRRSRAPRSACPPTTITVTVIADVNNGFRPGLFKGSWDGVKAWGDYINSKGGLALPQGRRQRGRLQAEPDRRHRTRSPPRAATRSRWSARPRCSSRTSARWRACKDKAGEATGIPDIAELQTEVAQQCSPISFATLPTGSSCPYSGTGLRTFHVGYTTYDYYFKQVRRGRAARRVRHPEGPPVDDRVVDADLPGREQDGHQERRRVRQERHCDPDRLHRRSRRR